MIEITKEKANEYFKSINRKKEFYEIDKLLDKYEDFSRKEI